MPYLSSGKESEKSVALIAISALGNEDIAVKLASALGGLGATSALASIATTAGPEGAASAERALNEIFRYLQSGTVSIVDDGSKPIGNGTIIHEDGLILTASYVAEKANYNRSVRVRTSTGILLDTVILTIDDVNSLALLRTKEKTHLSSIRVSNVTPVIGDRLIGIVNVGRVAGLYRAEVGSVVGYTRREEYGTDQIIASLRGVKLGSGGSPIVNGSGEIIGMLCSIVNDSDDTVIMVPASEISLFIKNCADSDDSSDSGASPLN